MISEFSVQVTATFEREYRKLLKGYPNLTACFARVVAALANDPHNRSRSYPIKRLTGVNPGDGQFRIRYLRYRFIYDIEGQIVFLKHCSLRREDTYK